MTTQKLEDLKEYVTSDDRICPNPDSWNNFSRVLRREAEHRGVSEKLPHPLILSGWWGSRDADKRQRLIEQIQYSEKNGFLEKAVEFLRSLHEEDWHHCPEERLHAPSSDELAMQENDSEEDED